MLQVVATSSDIEVCGLRRCNMVVAGVDGKSGERLRGRYALRRAALYWLAYWYLMGEYDLKSISGHGTGVIIFSMDAREHRLQGSSAMIR